MSLSLQSAAKTPAKLKKQTTTNTSTRSSRGTTTKTVTTTTTQQQVRHFSLSMKMFNDCIAIKFHSTWRIAVYMAEKIKQAMGAAFMTKSSKLCIAYVLHPTSQTLHEYVEKQPRKVHKTVIIHEQIPIRINFMYCISVGSFKPRVESCPDQTNYNKNQDCRSDTTKRRQQQETGRKIKTSVFVHARLCQTHVL